MRADRRFHLMIFIHSFCIVTCVRSTILLFFLAFCIPPTHIYRHAATDKLNLDSAVAKLYLIMLLIFYLALELNYSHLFLFMFLRSSQFFSGSLAVISVTLESVRGVERGIQSAMSTSMDLKKD